MCRVPARWKCWYICNTHDRFHFWKTDFTVKLDLALLRQRWSVCYQRWTAKSSGTSQETQVASWICFPAAVGALGEDFTWGKKRKCGTKGSNGDPESSFLSLPPAEQGGCSGLWLNGDHCQLLPGKTKENLRVQDAWNSLHAEGAGKTLCNYSIRKIITRAECEITAGSCEWRRTCIQR